MTEYRQAGHGKLVIEKFDPEPDSDAEDSARLDGIDAQNPLPGRPAVLSWSRRQSTCSMQRKSLAFLSPDRERQLEYDISRAISRVVTPEKATIGIMSALPVFGLEANS